MSVVLSIWKWTILQGKEEAYLEWVKDAIPRIVSIPGVVEFRGYRPVSGSSQVVVTYEFANLEDWAAWYGHEEAQQILTELRTVTANVHHEVWGPSPVAPKPVRPG
jgi:antibiotic biosynthesis monooxygenase (ABM) superfamily enzyme